MAMTDRERAVNRLKRLIKAAHNDSRDFVYVTVGTAGVIVRLLEEQEVQKFFVDESGKITPLPVVVRCKDCEHRGNSEKCVLSAISEEKNFPLFMLDNRGEWFCADGKRKET